MKVLFITIFIFASQLIRSVALDQQNGFNPYPFGTTIFCLAFHPLLLTSCIWYLGWIWGILIFICHLFGILHMTFTWLLELPIILTVKTDRQLLKVMKLKIGLLWPTLIITLVFMIFSFFLSEFKSLLYLFTNRPIFLIISVAIILISSIVRIIVAQRQY